MCDCSQFIAKNLTAPNLQGNTRHVAILSQMLGEKKKVALHSNRRSLINETPDIEVLAKFKLLLVRPKLQIDLK